MNSKIELKKGILIALEGIDGAGKTTQTKILQDTLAECGYSVSCFKEPTSGPWGLKIRDIAMNGRDHVQSDDELNYFLLDREEDVRNNIAPSLDNNQIVNIMTVNPPENVRRKIALLIHEQLYSFYYITVEYLVVQSALVMPVPTDSL